MGAHSISWALQGFAEDEYRVLYAFACQEGLDPDSAADITQGFLLHLFQQLASAGALQEIRNPHAYLMVSFRHFIADERRRSAAWKRGGRTVTLRLDAEYQADAEGPGRLESGTDEQANLSRCEARAFVTKVLDMLRDEYGRQGQEQRFQCIAQLLMAEEGRAPRELSENSESLRAP
jgi:DNA-directed RNA polymerase specialized sigma24 family protein